MSHPADRGPLEDHEIRRLAQDARGIYARLVEERPESAHQLLTDAMRHLMRLRDALIARARLGDGGADRLLPRVNAVASLGFGCQFPVAGVKWSRMEGARDALDALLAEDLR
jgi:hypothetical protein